MLEARGATVSVREVEDAELAMSGVLARDVREAWDARLARMGRLQAFLGDEFAAFRQDFLACLADRAHRSDCRVLATLALI